MSLIFPLPSEAILRDAVGLGTQREALFLFKVSKDFPYPYVQIEKKNNLKSACWSALTMHWFSPKRTARLCERRENLFRGRF